MSSCRRSRRHILLRHDDRLAVQEELELARHLETCAACRALDEEQRVLEEGFARLPEPPLERLDVERNLQAIRARLPLESREQATPSGTRRRPLKVAAALLAAAGLGLCWQALRPSDGGSREEQVAVEPAGGAPLRVDGDPLEPREVPAGPVAGEHPAEGQGETDDPPLDLDRLREVRAEVAALLAEAGAQLAEGADRKGALAFAKDFEARARPLAAGGWPLPRIAARLLREGEVETARAAARYLGVRADRLAVASLSKALSDERIARSAAHALGDAGERGLDGLHPALLDPDLLPIALAAASAAPEGAAIPFLARGLREAPPEPAQRKALLDALVASGPEALPSLLELASDGHLDTDLLTASLRGPGWSVDTLYTRLDARHPRRETTTLLRLLADLDPYGATPVIEEYCADRRLGGEALASLTRIDDASAVHVFVRLLDRGRPSARAVEDAWRTMLRRNPRAATAAARELWRSADRLGTRKLLEALILAEEPGAAEALASLAFPQHALSLDERRDAIAAVGELGDPGQVAAVTRLLSELEPDEGNLAATCLLSIHSLAGEPACAQALAGATPRVVETVLSQLRRGRAGGRETASTFRLARELKPWLEAQMNPDGSLTP